MPDPHRFMLNGQATLGPDQSFWRIDDTSRPERPDYNPIEFMQQPYALLNAKYVSADEAREIARRLGDVTPSNVGGTDE